MQSGTKLIQTDKSRSKLILAVAYGVTRCPRMVPSQAPLTPGIPGRDSCSPPNDPCRRRGLGDPCCLSGQSRNPTHQEPQMLCHNQASSSVRRAISLIDSSRLNEVKVISVVITVENAEKCLAKWCGTLVCLFASQFYAWLKTRLESFSVPT